MNYAEWKDRTDSFKKVDVRGIQGNFFQGLRKQAMDLPVGEGMEVVQSFEPIPLYEGKFILLCRRKLPIFCIL